MKKMLNDYGNFDLDSILEKLKRDYNDRGIELVQLEKNISLEHRQGSMII